MNLSEPPAINRTAASAVLVGLILRSVSLAACVGLAVLLVVALLSHT